MRSIIKSFLVASIILFAGLVHAQTIYATVTGTVTDPSGNPLAGAQYVFTLVDSVGNPVAGVKTPNGSITNAKTILSQLDANGFFSVSLLENNTLSSPAGTQWNIRISAPPLETQAYILDYQPAWTINYTVTITGPTDLSSQLSGMSQPIHFMNLKTGQNTLTPAHGTVTTVTGTSPVNCTTTGSSVNCALNTVPIANGGTGGTGGTGYAYGNGTSPLSYSTTIPYLQLSGAPTDLVKTDPTATQTITQPSGTTVAVNNINNVAYFSSGDVSAAITAYFASSTCAGGGNSCDAHITGPYTSSSTLIITMGTNVASNVYCDNRGPINYTGADAAVNFQGDAVNTDSGIHGCSITIPASGTPSGVSTAYAFGISGAFRIIIDDVYVSSDFSATNTCYDIAGDVVTGIIQNSQAKGCGDDYLFRHSIGTVNSGPNAWIMINDTSENSYNWGIHVKGNSGIQNLVINHFTSEGDGCSYTGPRTGYYGAISIESGQDFTVTNPYLENEGCGDAQMSIGNTSGWTMQGVAVNGGIWASSSIQGNINIISGSGVQIGNFLTSGEGAYAVNVGALVPANDLVISANVSPIIYAAGAKAPLSLNTATLHSESSDGYNLSTSVSGENTLTGTVVFPEGACTPLSLNTYTYGSYSAKFIGEFIDDTTNTPYSAAEFTASPTTPSLVVGAGTLTFSLNGSSQICGTVSGLASGHNIVFHGTADVNGRLGSPTYTDGPISTPALTVAGQNPCLADGTGCPSTTAAISGMTTGQLPIAASATTVTSSIPYAIVNTASTIVERSVSGNFAAGTITATLNGTASGNVTPTTLDNATLPASLTSVTDSGLTSGYYPLAGTSGLLGNGHLTDNGTTITSSLPMALGAGSTVSNGTSQQAICLADGTHCPILNSIIQGSIALTTATSDSVTMNYSSAYNSASCVFSPTNSTATTATILPYLTSTSTTVSVTVTINHAATVGNGATYNIVCSLWNSI